MSKETIYDRIVFPSPIQVYAGYSDVPMNTDNAWVETTVINFHDEDDTIFSDVGIKGGRDAQFVTWQTLSPALPLWASQVFFLRLVADLHDASF